MPSLLSSLANKLNKHKNKSSSSSQPQSNPGIAAPPLASSTPTPTPTQGTAAPVVAERTVQSAENTAATTSPTPASAVVPATTTTSNSQVDSSNMASSTKFMEFVKARRTFYPMTKDIKVPSNVIQQIVKDAVLHTPTSFNGQTNRAVVLLGQEHDKFWDITTQILKPIVTDNWEATQGKMNMFKGAAGTVLFFEDTSIVRKFQENIPAYAEKFPLWADQGIGMCEFVVWTALEAEGLGCSLQHYDPLVDDRIKSEWKLPADWKLNAQLVFGQPTGPAGEKEFQDVNNNVKVFGA